MLVCCKATFGSLTTAYLLQLLEQSIMKLSALLLPHALFTLASAQGEPCAAGVTLPCTCPNGTSYLESGTYVIAGVPSAQVLDMAFDFFNTTWQKRPIVSTEGISNTVGANRTIRVSSSVGTYDIKQTVCNPANKFLCNIPADMLGLVDILRRCPRWFFQVSL